MPTLEETRSLVRALFDGIVDKGGRPYHEHCERVEQYLPASATEDERHAALLHDVIEDTSVTADVLRERGYSARTVELVERLSRRLEDGTYMEWIRSIAASEDAGLIRIKLADNQDNRDPVRIERLPPEMRKDVRQRYVRARAALEAALTDGLG